MFAVVITIKLSGGVSFEISHFLHLGPLSIVLNGKNYYGSEKLKN